MTPHQSTILRHLRLEPLSTTDLQLRTGLPPLAIWKTLRFLQKTNLIHCTTPTFTRNRVYSTKAPS